MFKKNMTLTANVFLKLETAKGMVRKMSKKARFKTPFYSQHARSSQTLLKSVTKCYYLAF